MAERPTAGWDIEFDEDGVIGILQEFDINYDGDTEDISGTGDTEGGKIRRKGKPVDVGAILTISGKIDEDADGFDNFRSAMKARTEDSVIQLLKDGDGWSYEGHSDQYNEAMSRSEAVWNFSLTFYVNDEDTVTAA